MSEQYEQLKNDGNALFKQKKIQEALEKFTEGSQQIEQNHPNIQEQNDAISKIYLQILTNKALCELNLGKNEHVVQTTDKVMKIDINNPKALYRYALAKRNLADQILTIFNNNLKMIPFQQIQQIEKYYEDSRFKMEILSKLEPNNKSVKNELSEIVKNQVRIKLQYRELKKTNPELFQDKKDKEEAKKQEEENHEEEVKINVKKDQNKNKRIVNKLDTDELKKISEMAIQQNTNALLADTKLPETASIFEKNISAFKTTPQKLFTYLQKIPADHYAKLYKSQDIPVEILFQITNCIQQFGTENQTKQDSLNTLDGLSKTNKFSLCMMCMTKKEKQVIKQLLDKLEAPQDLYKNYKLQ